MPEIQEKSVKCSATDVVIPTTTETVVISSGPVKVPRQTCLAHVRAWCHMWTGTGTTAVTPRIRRGTNTSGTLVSEANAETIKVPAGSMEPFTMEAVEQRSNEDTVEYSLTLQQTNATADGTVGQAAIEVEILGG